MASKVIISLLCLTLLGVSSAEIVFYESFTTDFKDGKTWVVSESAEYTGEWKHSAPEDTKDFGLLVSQKARKYAIAAELPTPVDPKVDSLVLQYDLRLQEGIECGGAYLKFLMPQESGWSASQFKDVSPYSIMFGPDKCGTTNKVHFIFRHKSPKTGEYIEHHLKDAPTIVNDKLSHVYTAIVHPNNTLQILIDGEVKKTADLLSNEFDPAVLPPKTISDPEDKKPEDWDEREKIPDPSATKPDDWDENAPRLIEDLEAKKPEGWLDDEALEIDDPESTKPDDWDDAEDGEFEPSKIPNPLCKEAPGCGEWKRPTIKNPAYKGKWTAPLIKNPAYQGVWKPKDIDNPDYFSLDRPNLEPVAAVGIEIWTMNDGILFDNILVASDAALAESYIAKTWKPKFEKEQLAAKAKEEKEEEERKKSAQKGSEPKTPLQIVTKGVFDNLHKVAELPFLKPVKKQIITALDFLESRDETAYAGVAVLFALFVLAIYLLLPGKKTASRSEPTVEQSKKEDIPVPDDAPGGEEEEESKAGEESKEKAEEVAEAEIEEEEEDKNVRRRTRRQA